MRDLLGGKGAGLAEMANLGLPVPPGFTITTEVCTYYYGTTRVPEGFARSGGESPGPGRPHCRKEFGDKSNPLRSPCGRVRALRCPA